MLQFLTFEIDSINSVQKTKIKNVKLKIVKCINKTVQIQ